MTAQQPDEERDVLVRHRRAFDPGPDRFEDEWTVWIGRRKDWVFASEERALEHALALAVKYGRPAWRCNETDEGLTLVAID